MTDEELVALSLLDSRFYDLLVERHRQPLFNFIFFRLLAQREKAEDIVQDAFLKAFIRLETFDSNKKFKTWIYRIAINSAVSSYRQVDFDTLEEYAYLDLSDPADFVEKSLQVDRLNNALARLPSDKSLIINLYYIQGKDFSEISKEIKKPIHEVKNRLLIAERLLIKSYHIDS